MNLKCQEEGCKNKNVGIVLSVRGIGTGPNGGDELSIDIVCEEHLENLAI